MLFAGLIIVMLNATTLSESLHHTFSELDLVGGTLFLELLDEGRSEGRRTTGDSNDAGQML